MYIEEDKQTSRISRQKLKKEAHTISPVESGAVKKFNLRKRRRSAINDDNMDDNEDKIEIEKAEEEEKVKEEIASNQNLSVINSSKRKLNKTKQSDAYDAADEQEEDEVVSEKNSKETAKVETKNEVDTKIAIKPKAKGN